MFLFVLFTVLALASCSVNPELHYFPANPIADPMPSSNHMFCIQAPQYHLTGVIFTAGSSVKFETQCVRDAKEDRFYLVENNHIDSIGADEKFQLGYQTHGGARTIKDSVLVRADNGDLIPGKGRGGERRKAWYSYGGKEKISTKFFYLVAREGSSVYLKKASSPPANSLGVGRQGDGTNSGFGMIYYMSICHSQHGDVPGKASNNRAWYPWGGVEHRCDDFSYVVVDGGYGEWDTTQQSGDISSEVLTT